MFGPPQSMKTTASSNSLQISWMEPNQGGGAATITSYLVIYNNNGVSSFEEVYESTEITIEALLSNTVYYVTLAARGSNGYLGDSSAVNAVTSNYIRLMESQTNI